jgi:hypothetical protein
MRCGRTGVRDALTRVDETALNKAEEPGSGVSRPPHRAYNRVRWPTPYPPRKSDAEAV